MGHGVEGHATAASDLDARTAKAVATTMQALATPSRLMILGRLRRAPATVGELAVDVAMEQSAVSHQLRLLRNLGLVEGERQGRSIVYALYDNHVAELLDQAVFHSEHLRLGAIDRPVEASEPRPAAALRRPLGSVGERPDQAGQQAQRGANTQGAQHRPAHPEQQHGCDDRDS